MLHFSDSLFNSTAMSTCLRVLGILFELSRQLDMYSIGRDVIASAAQYDSAMAVAATVSCAAPSVAAASRTSRYHAQF